MLSGVSLRLTAAILSSWLLLVSQSIAQAGTRLELPAQPLAEALRSLANQTRTNILFDPDSVKSFNAPAVKNAASVADVLTRILAGSGLTYRYLDDRTVTIVPAGRATATPHMEQGEGIGSAVVGHNLGPAQAGAAEVPQLEEVVVTAQKRSERLQDVPMSIVAITADELQQRNITNIDDLSLAVPGLSIMSDGSATRRIMLRGISNTAGNGSTSLVGLYLDEASVTGGLSSQLDLQTYDLERVEILRGPQGTLYGDGSVGGTIRFITRNPALDRFEMNADVTALFTEYGAPSQHIAEVVNIPLLENELGLRIAGTFNHDGGWIDQPAAGQENINARNLADVRVKASWQPAADFTVNAMAVIHRKQGGLNSGEDANGNYTQTFNLTTTPTTHDDFNIYNLTLAYDLAAVRLLSTSTYIDQQQRVDNVGTFFQITPPGTGLYEVYQNYSGKNETFSEELRLSSNGSGPWRWTLGGFYRHALGELDTPVAYADFGGPPGTPLPAPLPASEATTSSKSVAVFGDTSYQLAERLTLGAGLRYFHDDQASSPPEQSGTFHATSPRGYAQYRISERANVYASAAKGFRSGGFNYAPNVPTFAPESVWTYELGTKMSLLDHRLSIDADLFYSKYQNYIVAGLDPAQPQLGNYYQNAGNAVIKGVEWDLAWRALEHWTFSLNGDYLHAVFTRINSADTVYVVGDPLDLFPRYTFTVSVQREFQWLGKPGFARVDYNQQGRETFRDRNVAGPTPWYFGESDVISMLNVNTGWHWSDNLTLGLFAQNLLNERGLISPYSPNTESDAEIRPRPRTFGVNFSVKFD